MVYHVTNKSIAGFKIFNDEKDYERMMMAILYYQHAELQIALSHFLRSEKIKNISSFKESVRLFQNEKLVGIISYNTMPTHPHLMLEQLKKDGISIFMNNVLNSYTRYFNIKHKRKGPLWEGRSQKALIESDDLLLHITRYIHLNPVTAHLVNKAEYWPCSSYKEYISNVPDNKRVCNYRHLLDIEYREYKKFTEDQISYQRSLAKIKNLVLEEPSYQPRRLVSGKNR